MLLYLFEHHDRLVTRRELLEQFQEGHDVYDETLTKCVGAIRKAPDDQTEPHASSNSLVGRLLLYLSGGRAIDPA